MLSRTFAHCARVLTLAAALLGGAVSAAEVQVMISAGFFGAYAELGPAFERASGHRLTTTRGPSLGDSPEAIPNRLARGETADVVILDDSAADELGRRGWVRPESKVELARSQIGMVVRAGAAKPDIGSVDAFRSALLAAKSIAYSDSSSGTYLVTPARQAASPIRSPPRAARCAGRRRASRWPRSSPAARPRSASSRSASCSTSRVSTSSARSRPRCSRASRTRAR